MKVFVILRKGPERGADFHIAGVYADCEDALKARAKGMGKPGTTVTVEAHEVIPKTPEPEPEG